MANGVYNRGMLDILNFDVDASTYRMMLVNTDYSFSILHKTVDDGTSSDPKSSEISVGGYSRQSITGMSLYELDTTGFAAVDATDVTFSALVAGQTVAGAVVYRYSTAGSPNTTSDTGQDLICFYDVSDTPTNGGDITIQFASTSAGSMLKLGTTS